MNAIGKCRRNIALSFEDLKAQNCIVYRNKDYLSYNSKAGIYYSFYFWGYVLYDRYKEYFLS